MLSAFGVGLSWSCCVIDIRNAFNGGIIKYILPDNIPTRMERVKQWIGYFKGDNDI